MKKWLNAALDYLPRWLQFQLRHHEQPGCVVALAYRDRIVLEESFGYADLAGRTPLTPRHRFRVASHSKSFAAAVPVRGKVLVARPDFFNPFLDASEIRVHGADRGRIMLAPGYASHGEPARLHRGKRGRVSAVQLGGGWFKHEAEVARELAPSSGIVARARDRA